MVGFEHRMFQKVSLMDLGQEGTGLVRRTQCDSSNQVKDITI